MAHRRQKLCFQDDESCGWIPGLGDNKPRPQSARSQRSGGSSSINDCISDDVCSTRSGSPRPGSEIFGGSRRRPRTAGASDSSQMRDIMWTPPSPEKEEVEEETCVEINVQDKKAIPFFTHDSGCIYIQGGTVVNEDKMDKADIIIEDGKIVQVGAELEVPSGAKVIDATEKFIIPGGIDPCTNFRGEDLADDLNSGTRAALAGGTTTIMELVIPDKDQSLIDAVNAWKEDIEELAFCDVALTVAIPRWNESIKDDITQLVKEEGINNFKVYMAFKNELMLTNEELLDLFDHCKSLGAVVHVHAENGTIIAENEKRLRAKGVRGPEAILMARPEEIEEEAVKRVCTLARHSNVPIIIDQPTGQSAIEVIRNQKEKGQVVVGQASALSMAKNGAEYYNEIWSNAAAIVTSPPLRDDPDIQEGIIDAALDDVFASVCSNHKAYTNEKKKSLGKNDFTHIPHGHNGVEERLAILWEQLVFNEKSTASKFVALSSSNSAKIMNLWPQKGCIAPESDADLVIWNPNNFRTISSKEHSESNADVNAFDGLTVHGAPEYVIANGKVVVYEYEMNPNVSQGQVLVAEPFPCILYDQVQDLDELSKVVGVQRNQPAEEVIEEVDTVDRGGSNQDFGMTTPRKTSEPPVLNKRLGIYQRPMSAHGVRNQQDSTFSLAGDGDFGSPKRTVKINAPPGGGGSRAFW